MTFKQNIKSILRKAIGFNEIHTSLEKLIKQSEVIQQKISTPAETIQPPAQNTLGVREQLAREYLHGSGLEIGAFASPLRVPPGVHVAYLDRYDPVQMENEHRVAGLTPQDFGFDPAALIVPDIVDDGQTLAKVGDLTQDFVIANHVLEHFENPVQGFKNMLRVLKHGGVLYLALPEMQHSFDRIRQPTPFEHIWRDFEEGPAWSRPMAYADFARVFVENGMEKNLFPQKSGAEREAFERYVASELERANYSIHFHAWRMSDMLEMFLQLQKRLKIGHQIETVKAHGDEVIFIFRKTPYPVVT